MNAISKTIQHILDNGFFVSYTFDARDGIVERTIQKIHHFKVWKYHAGEIYQISRMIDDTLLCANLSANMMLRYEADSLMMQVDDVIAKRITREEKSNHERDQI